MEKKYDPARSMPAVEKSFSQFSVHQTVIEQAVLRFKHCTSVALCPYTGCCAVRLVAQKIPMAHYSRQQFLAVLYTTP